MISNHGSPRAVPWPLLACMLMVACPPHAVASTLHAIPETRAVQTAMDHGRACEHLLGQAADLVLLRRLPPAGAHPTEKNQPPDVVWTELPPAPRVWSQAAAYDARRDRMVIFGGDLSNGPLTNGTWAQNLSSGDWRELRPRGIPPPPCTDHSMIYDPVRDRMIVCGGGGTDPGAVWALSLSDPPTWSEVHASGTPPAFSGHTAIYDPLRDRMVVFGGFSAENATWSMSLGEHPEWREIEASNVPPGRLIRHAATYDPIRDRMLVFGGSTGPSLAGLSNDVWALPLSGPAEWERIVAPGPQPTPRQGTAIYDPVHDALLVFGGHQNIQPYLCSDTWLLSLGSDPRWTRLADAPSARWHHTAILDPLRNRMVVFGGYPGADNQAWTLSLTSVVVWQPLGGMGPAGRASCVAVYDSHRQRMIVHGGSDGYGALAYLSDTWAMSTNEPWHWVSLDIRGPIPPGRYAHTAIFDEMNDRVVIFGGYGVEGVMNDVWAFEMDGSPRWQRVEATGEAPAPRAGHSAVYDRARQQMIVYGGMSPGDQGPDYFGDAWELSLAGPPRWRPLQPSGVSPVARAEHSAVYDPVNKEVIVYGGGTYLESIQDFQVLGDTWALSLRGNPRWRLVAEDSFLPTHPGPRDRHVAVYDGANHRMLVFGGSRGGGPFGALSNLWALPLAALPPVSPPGRPEGEPPGHRPDATQSWQRLDTAGPTPPGRYEHCAIFDPVGSALVAFGGIDGIPLHDTWAAVVSDGGHGRIAAHSTTGGHVATCVHTPVTAGASLTPLSVEMVSPASPGGGWVIAFTTSSVGSARIELLDVTGRRLASSTIDVPSMGRRTVEFAGSVFVPPGVYFLRIQQNSRAAVRKVFVAQ